MTNVLTYDTIINDVSILILSMHNNVLNTMSKPYCMRCSNVYHPSSLSTCSPPELVAHLELDSLSGHPTSMICHAYC